MGKEWIHYNIHSIDKYFETETPMAIDKQSEKEGVITTKGLILNASSQTILLEPSVL